jgi:hypothetical protein
MEKIKSCYSVDESQKYYAKSKKSNTKQQLLYDLLIRNTENR